MSQSTLPVPSWNLDDLSLPEEEVVEDEVAATTILGLPSRYQVGTLLGKGGTSEVYRVFDKVLRRHVALKTLRGRLIHKRFLEEAQRTARLIHPSIIPIYDAGILEDERPWFTMRQVQGKELEQVIAEVHVASPERWSEAPSGWSFQRLLSAFLSICDAVGYAHEQGVVHRDLKPQNVMIGDHGEVLVLDWGLSRWSEAFNTDNPLLTQVGAVMGTPAYMPPEQAQGQSADARSDVWSLGAILYQILRDAPPYVASGMEATLTLARRGEVPTLTEMRIPEELKELCGLLLSADPALRPANGKEVARLMRRYLEGALQRERALALVQQAQQLRAEAEEFGRKAEEEERAYKEEIAKVPPWADTSAKLHAWEREQAAQEARTERSRLLQESEALFEAALTHDPGLPEAHAPLLEISLSAHAAADATSAPRIERQLRQHLAALAPAHPLHQKAARYLHGNGFLSLHTEPPGAQALLYRYEPFQRRLVEVFVKDLGRTPLLEVPLPHGSYVVRLRIEGRVEVVYPVLIERVEHWDGVPPGEREPLPIWLPERLEEGEVYVPGGWALFGSPPISAGVLGPHRRWVDAFAIRRFPVTNAEYIRVLDRLSAEGREDLISEVQPHLFGGKDVNNPVYGRHADGTFFLRPDGEGDIWLPDWPVIMISSLSARRFAEYLGWRLPCEHEWEKAARGVDGRRYPWGDRFEPSFCLMRDSLPPPPFPGRIQDFPADEGPYGVRGMAGNVVDWTRDPYREEIPAGMRIMQAHHGDSSYWVGKGGGWQHRDVGCLCAARAQLPAHVRRADLGVRPVRPLTR